MSIGVINMSTVIPQRPKKISKKKLLVRIDPILHEELKKWAADDFRSLNAHIEFILNKALRENRRGE
jgi:hypothetical protein|tara:strand:- start:40 stop:240 length:201 start_codon:yes stop_codon:yes gene_type:complete